MFYLIEIFCAGIFLTGKVNNNKTNITWSVVKIKPFELWLCPIFCQFCEMFSILHSVLASVLYLLHVLFSLFSLSLSLILFSCMARSSTPFFQRTLSTWGGSPPSKLYTSSLMPLTHHIVSMLTSWWCSVLVIAELTLTPWHPIPVTAKLMHWDWRPTHLVPAVLTYNICVCRSAPWLFLLIIQFAEKHSSISVFL